MVGQYLETLKVCSIRLQVATNPAGYFRGKISPQLQKRTTRLITVTNYQFSDHQLLPLHVLRQIIFSFQLVENIDGYRSGWNL